MQGRAGCGTFRCGAVGLGLHDELDTGQRVAFVTSELLLEGLVDGVGVHDLDQMVRCHLQLGERQRLRMRQQACLRCFEPVGFDTG